MPEHDPRQGSLFEIQETEKSPATTEPSSYQPNTEVVLTPAPEGLYPDTDLEEEPEVVASSVDILERNRALTHAIGKIASISRAEGLSKANQIPAERGRLQDRYGNRHQDVVGNTVKKSERVAEEVPEDFAAAWGLQDVVSSGLMSEQDAEKTMAEDYRKFEAWYGGSGAGADRREAKRKWLNYQRRTINQERTRKPKARYPRHPRSS